MVFEPKTFAELFADMRDRTPPRITDFEEGSVARTLYESFSYELALLYEQMQRVYLSAFVDTATGEQLDRVVTILGIKRGEPDFATGLVTFERDLGIEEDITVPVNTLVTTSEDASETLKKAFETIETVTIPMDQTTVQARVQAVRRGEAEATAAETVQVMPQPVPGVKAVKNEAPIQFMGKRRETDEELRDRAKKALLAASGANPTAIENALLSLSGVKEVKVREKFQFDFAQGTVILSREASAGELTIPEATLLQLSTDGRRFETTETTLLRDSERSVEVGIRAVNPGVTGRAPEALSWEDLKLPNPDSDDVTLQVTNVEPISLSDLGMVEVFVDGVDFQDPVAVDILRQEIDRVRAAGIYVLLKPANPVGLEGVFQIELDPGLRLSPEERIRLEAEVQAAILAYLEAQRMGQPLLVSQITKNILSMSGINDLINFSLTAWRGEGAQAEKTLYDSDVKRLPVDVLEKFVPQSIRVASETKPLPVRVQVQALALNDHKQAAIEAALATYFERPRSTIRKSEIESHLVAALGQEPPTETVADASQGIVRVKLSPQFWQSHTPFDGETVEVSFVEQAHLDQENLFIYDKFLEITGALKLTLPLTATEREKQTLRDQVQHQIEDYLEGLSPEENVEIEQLAQIAIGVEQVLDVAWQPEDFHLHLTQDEDSQAVDDRIDGTVIKVERFEKTRLATDFVIVSDIQTVAVTITALTLRLDITGQLPANIAISQLQVMMREAIQNTLTGPIHQTLPKLAVGQSLDYEQLKANFQSAISEAVQALSREAIQALVKLAHGTVTLQIAEEVEIREPIPVPLGTELPLADGSLSVVTIAAIALEDNIPVLVPVQTVVSRQATATVIAAGASWQPLVVPTSGSSSTISLMIENTEPIQLLQLDQQQPVDDALQQLAEQAKTFLRGAGYALEALDLDPVGGNIFVRSVERAVLQPLAIEAEMKLEMPLSTR